MEMSDRKLKILSAVVDSYVKTGEPVSSKNLCNILDFSTSSATIRNELAELTELGFLEQPHTSAGRIPSHLGYRLYINKLMGKVSLPSKTKNYIDSSLNSKIVSPESILKEAANLLSQITNFAVISTNISSHSNFIKNIQLVKIGNFSAMIILSTSSGIIKNQLFKCDYLLSDEIIDKICNILNTNFTDVSVNDITPAFIQTIAVSLGEFAFIMSDIFAVLLNLSEQISKINIHLDGQINLLSIPNINQKSVVNVINLFNDSEDIYNLFLPESKNKTRIFIGEETHYDELSQSSIIITRYHTNNELHGSIGVVGPTRMNYATSIAKLEYIASSIGEILNHLLNIE